MKNSNYVINLIDPLETHAVRHPVLRKGRPIEDCVFVGDHLETTFHLGISIENRLIGVSTFMKNKKALFPETSQYQLRGMAVLHEYQGQSFGHILLKHGENLLKNDGINLIWCHARETALNFYIKNDYQPIGEAFDIPKIGWHFVMYKRL